MSRDDGLFWISFEDFCQHYRTIDYCRLVNLPGWLLYFYESSWLPLEGGRISLTSTFLLNPQFILTTKLKTCSISIIINQSDVFDEQQQQTQTQAQAQQTQQEDTGESNQTTQYKNIYLFKLNDLGISYTSFQNKQTLQYQKINSKLLLKNKNIFKKCSTFQNSRDIYLEFVLEKDQPVLIVPSTYDPVKKQTYFTIKCFTTSECELIQCI